MRRIYYVIPVAALGAGGFFWWHHTSHVTPVQARQGVRMRDGRIYVQPAPGSSAGGVIAPAGSAAFAAQDPGNPASPSASPSAASASPAGVTASSAAPVIVAPPGAKAAKPDPMTQREEFDERNSLAGENRKLAVPVPGVDKARKKVGAVAACQGPQAEQHYATLTGTARSNYARACARIGVTLPP